MKCGWQGKPKYSEKTCPGAILSTTNPTCQTRARTYGPVTAGVTSDLYVMALTCILVTRHGHAEYEYEIECDIVRNNSACTILL
jgi:hypothetical protein